MLVLCGCFINFFAKTATFVSLVHFTPYNLGCALFSLRFFDKNLVFEAAILVILQKPLCSYISILLADDLGKYSSLFESAQ